MKKKEPFVRLERKLVEHRAYRMAGPIARDLYTCMMNSLYNDNNGWVNRSLKKVSFGPSDAKLFWYPEKHPL